MASRKSFNFLTRKKHLETIIIVILCFAFIKNCFMGKMKKGNKKVLNTKSYNGKIPIMKENDIKKCQLCTFSFDGWSKMRETTNNACCKNSFDKNKSNWSNNDDTIKCTARSSATTTCRSTLSSTKTSPENKENESVTYKSTPVKNSSVTTKESHENPKDTTSTSEAIPIIVFTISNIS